MVQVILPTYSVPLCRAQEMCGPFLGLLKTESVTECEQIEDENCIDLKIFLPVGD